MSYQKNRHDGDSYEKDRQASAKRINRIAKILDSQYRLGPVKLGWDAILGLLPGIGDSLGSIASSYIVYEAVKLNMSKSTIARMIVNIFLDSLFGMVPFVGDFVDVFWKSNQKNAVLFSNAVEEPRRSAAYSTVWLIAVVALLFLAIFLSLYIPLKILSLLIK